MKVTDESEPSAARAVAWATDLEIQATSSLRMPTPERVGSMRGISKEPVPRIARVVRAGSKMSVVKTRKLGLSQKQFHDEILKCMLMCAVFVLLLIIPHEFGQYGEEQYLVALSRDQPSYVTAEHADDGLLEAILTASPCHMPNSSDVGPFWLKAHVVQGGRPMAGNHSLMNLHIDYQVHHGRRLSGGGGETHDGVTGMHDFDLTDLQVGGDPVELVLETNCPTAVSTLIKLSVPGAVGRLQVPIAAFLLVAVLLLILTEVIHRMLAAFVGSSSVLFVLALEHRLPAVSTIIGWMDHGTLGLLFGMMVIVALLAKTGIFEWLAVRVFQASGSSLWRLFVLLMLFNCVLSAFLDNVTAMLLLGPVVISLCKAIEVDPKPMLISLALFGSVGGTATMIGDPPNIIIGNALSDEIGFMDFLTILGPGSCLIVTPCLMFVRWYYGDEYFNKPIQADAEKLKQMYPIKDSKLLLQAGSVLGVCILMFFLHPVTHLDPAYTACFGAVLLLLQVDHHDLEHALERVEWDSLLFFAGLFVFTEGLAELGLLREIADVMSSVISMVPVAQRQLAANIILHLVSAVVSAFVDNIPFTTTMIPVIRRMTANVEGLQLKPLAWSLAFGADLGGMGTLIGASNNVIMAGIAHEAGHHVSFLDFFKIGFPMMCIAAGFSCVYMIVLQQAGLLA